MARLRNDIYDSACGVDAQDAAQGNLSGVAAQTETVTQKALEAKAQNGAAAFQNQLPPELKATAKVDFDTVDEGTVTRTAQTLFKPKDFSERIWANRDVLVKDLERSISHS